jgi:8-oxo-dGTP pyrophosphatase MutT (NUDIX family)
MRRFIACVYRALYARPDRYKSLSAVRFLGKAMPIEQTLCHVKSGKRLLLKRANRGISVGKWNAPGGNVEDGESPEECAIRELFEETGLKVTSLFRHGIMNFYNAYGKNELDVVVHLFSTETFGGEIRHTEEGEVRWFDKDKLPFDEMWDDDRYWLDLMLDGRRFDADFHFDKKDKKVVKYSVTFK